MNLYFLIALMSCLVKIGRSISDPAISSFNISIRCLEEGADEFFLKPVRLSDMSKLKPHILKRRCKEHYQQEQRQQIDSQSNESSNPTHNSRKRKAAADDEILPQIVRLRHS
jgi:two-component response regulator ARR-A family